MKAPLGRPRPTVGFGPRAAGLFSADYSSMFSDLPVWLIQVRHGVSWLVRLAGVAAGAGICAGSERARRLGVALGWFTVATVLWKHPRGAIEYSLKMAGGGPHAFIGDKGLAELGWSSERAWSYAVTATRALVCSATAAVFGGIAFYLSRPSVRAAFAHGDAGQDPPRGGAKPQERKPSP